MIIIFSGSIGRFPVGGHAWINMQYLVGLRALGHEVFYLEDCGEESWVHNWETDEPTTDLSYPAAYLRDCLEQVGFGDRWIYRAGDSAEGMPVEQFRDACSRADLMIVRGVPIGLWRTEYSWPRRRIFIDVDPGFTQISLMNGDADLAATVIRCDRLFTIGQRLGHPDCPIPMGGHQWLRTTHPVWLPAWKLGDPSDPTHFTTVLQWQSYGKGHRYRKVSYNGTVYRQKGEEFSKFITLPQLTTQPFRIALTGGSTNRLAESGWEVAPGWIVTRTPSRYRHFIQGSRAEFGIAKHGYVSTRSGWFSDRSVCYLASGKPVLTQDTGVSQWLPIGQGVLTFRDIDEALRGITAINADYERHCQAARHVAEEYFASERVLRPLLEMAMN